MLLPRILEIMIQVIQGYKTNSSQFLNHLNHMDLYAKEQTNRLLILIRHIMRKLHEIDFYIERVYCLEYIDI